MEEVANDVIWMSQGPYPEVMTYDGYCINDLCFHCKSLEVTRRTQNSGVVLDADTSCYSNSRDQNPTIGKVTYYCQLEEVVELEYGPSLQIVVFKCQWFDEQTMSCLRKDQYNFTCINFS